MSFPTTARERFAGIQPDGFFLRPAREGDMAFLRRLYRRSRAGELAAVSWSAEQKAAFCDSQFMFQHQDWTARYPGAWFLVVMRRGAPVGRLYVDPPGQDYRVIDIGLLPDWRGKGLGTALLGGVQRLAARDGVGVVLSVLPDNTGARALYHRLGFRPVGETPRDIAMRWSGS